MRGKLAPQADMFCLLSPESFVPQDHLLRAIKLYKKAAGQAVRLCHGLHVLMENRHGLCADLAVASALEAETKRGQ